MHERLPPVGPALTAMALARMGAAALDTMLPGLGDPRHAEYVWSVPELVARGSSGPPPQEEMTR